MDCETVLSSVYRSVVGGFIVVVVLTVVVDTCTVVVVSIWGLVALVDGDKVVAEVDNKRVVVCAIWGVKDELPVVNGTVVTADVRCFVARLDGKMIVVPSEVEVVVFIAVVDDSVREVEAIFWDVLSLRVLDSGVVCIVLEIELLFAVEKKETEVPNVVSIVFVCVVLGFNVVNTIELEDSVVMAPFVVILDDVLDEIEDDIAVVDVFCCTVDDFSKVVVAAFAEVVVWTTVLELELELVVSITGELEVVVIREVDVSTGVDFWVLEKLVVSNELKLCVPFVFEVPVAVVVAIVLLDAICELVIADVCVVVNFPNVVVVIPEDALLELKL